MKASGEVYAALPLGSSWSVVRVQPGGGYVTIGELPLLADAVVRWDEDGRLWALDREGGTPTSYPARSMAATCVRGRSTRYRRGSTWRR